MENALLAAGFRLAVQLWKVLLLRHLSPISANATNCNSRTGIIYDYLYGYQLLKRARLVPADSDVSVCLPEEIWPNPGLNWFMRG